MPDTGLRSVRGDEKCPLDGKSPKLPAITPEIQKSLPGCSEGDVAKGFKPMGSTKGSTVRD